MPEIFATAQQAVAADRFVREIGGFLKASPGALAATECQSGGPHLIHGIVNDGSWIRLHERHKPFTTYQ